MPFDVLLPPAPQGSELAVLRDLHDVGGGSTVWWGWRVTGVVWSAELTLALPLGVIISSLSPMRQQGSGEPR